MYLNQIKKVSPIGLLVVGFIVGVILTYLFLQPKLIYQGKTAQEWAKQASDEAWNNLNSNKILEKYTREVYMNDTKNQATPNPTPSTTQYSNSDQLNESSYPPGAGVVCVATIKAYLKAGWNMNQINHMLKANNSVCAPL